MPAHRHRVGRAVAGLLIIVMAAGCGRFGPHLHIGIDNAGGPKDVTVTVESSGPGTTGSEDIGVPAWTAAELSVPLGSTWEVKVDGKHVIGSDDRADLPIPSPGQRRDVMISLRVAADGTAKLLEACLDEDYVDGRCATQ